MSLTMTCCQGYEMSTGQDLTYVTSRQSRDVTAFAPWGQSIDPISLEVANKITFSTGLFLIPLFALLGVPGNILSAIVFYRQGLRERINLCLFALAIVDLVVVLVLLFTLFENQIRSLFLPHAWFFATKVQCLIGFFWASQFLSAVIASERCFCVVSPFHAKRLLKTSTMAAIIVVCSSILTGGLYAIACPKYTVMETLDPVTNTTREIFYVTRYYLENKYIVDILDIFVYGTCLPGLFLIIIVITTVLTIISLRSAVSKRHTMTKANDCKQESSKFTTSLSSKELTVTRMLIGTSILFIICLTPNFVGQLTTFIVPDLSLNGKYYNLKMVLWCLTSLLRVVNCSVNTCIYYTLGSKFRQILHEMCGYCIGKKGLVQNGNKEEQSDVNTTNDMIG